MADDACMALEELLRQAQLNDDVDVLYAGTRAQAQALMGAEVTVHVDAAHYERTPERTGNAIAHMSGAETPE